MNWEDIVKRSNSDEIDNILDSYSQLQSIVKEVFADMIPFVSLLQNGDYREANDTWKEMRGNVMDLEGTMNGIKEVNAFITKMLGDA